MVIGSSYTVWGSILKSVKELKEKGADLLSFCKRRIGIGDSTRFWKDVWIGDEALCCTYPRLYALELIKGGLVSTKLSSGALT